MCSAIARAAATLQSGNRMWKSSVVAVGRNRVVAHALLNRSRQRRSQAPRGRFSFLPTKSGEEIDRRSEQRVSRGRRASIGRNWPSLRHSPRAEYIPLDRLREDWDRMRFSNSSQRAPTRSRARSSPRLIGTRKASFAPAANQAAKSVEAAGSYRKIR